MDEIHGQICPICRNKDPFTRLFTSEGFQVYLCHTCCIIFTRQHPQDWLHYYTNIYDNRLNASRKIKKFSLNNFIRVRWINRQLPLKNAPNLIEVGCGSGLLLKLLSSKGARVFGLDPGPRAIAIAAKAIGEKNVVRCMLTDYNPLKLIDGVLLIQTFEHLQDPIGALSAIKNWLKPDGYMFIEVPNFFAKKGFYRIRTSQGKIPSPNHLFVYTPKTLSRLIQSAGFHLVKVTSPGQNIRIIAQKQNSSYTSQPLNQENLKNVLAHYQTIKERG